MSRIGKKPIDIPSGVSASLAEGSVLVKGPKGELSLALPKNVAVVEGEEKTLAVEKGKGEGAEALWGAIAAHIKNMIRGVTEGFSKVLVLEGIGYRAEVRGKELVLSLGFSHPVHISVPEGMTVAVEKNVITISGIDRGSVGQFAAKIRALKKPEPYKGKGIRYENEVVRRKQGKRAVT